MFHNYIVPLHSLTRRAQYALILLLFGEFNMQKHDSPITRQNENLFSFVLAYSESWQSDRSRWTRNPVYPFRVSGV